MRNKKSENNKDKRTQKPVQKKQKMKMQPTFQTFQENRHIDCQIKLNRLNLKSLKINLRNHLNPQIPLKRSRFTDILSAK